MTTRIIDVTKAIKLSGLKPQAHIVTVFFIIIFIIFNKSDSNSIMKDPMNILHIINILLGNIVSYNLYSNIFFITLFVQQIYLNN
jgi:hypothetical protein